MALHACPSPDEVALGFLDALYRDVETGWLSLFSVSRDGDERGQPAVDWRRVEDRDELATIAVDRAEHADVWFGVATRYDNLGPRRGGIEDCRLLPGLWLDVDVAGPTHKVTERLPTTLEQARALVASFPLPATALVATGGGLHAWWALAEPMAVDWAALDLLAAFGTTWAQLAERRGLRVDNVFNADRVMRLPGTVNRKAGITVPVVVVEADWDRRYGADEIDDHLLEAPVAPLRPRAAMPYIGPERPGDDYNARHPGSEVLHRLGFALARTDRNGDEHWTGPWKDVREGTSATVYAEDGHVTIWSDSATARWPRVQVRNPYTPFALLTMAAYDGDFTAAAAELRAQGYGDAPAEVEGLVAEPATEEPIEPEGDEPTTWVPVDLTDALAGGDVPQPDLFARTDGMCLVYRGRVHWFMGESESCKTWAGLGCAAQVLDQDGRILWIDFEDDDRTVVARLRALRVDPEAIRARFTYVRPDEPLRDRSGRSTRGGVDFAALLAQSWDLAVIDGVTEAMLTEGLDLLDNSDIASWMRLLPRRLAATGAAVIALDHVTKAKDDRGRYAIGGQHKLAGLTGAAYRFDVVRSFSRSSGIELSTGAVTVTVGKDRAGYVRARTVDGRVATLELTGWPDGGVSVALVPPDTQPASDLALCRRIAEYLSVYEGASQNAIARNVEGKTDAIRDALRWMVEEPREWLRVETVGMTHRHYVTDEGRDAFGTKGPSE